MSFTSTVASALAAFKSGGSPSAAAERAASTNTVDPSSTARPDGDDDAGTGLAGDFDGDAAVEDVAGAGVSQSEAEDADLDEGAGLVEASQQSDAVEGGESGEDGTATASGDTEELQITDERGRRVIKVDYSNRDAIKQAFRQAAGMRKFQTERDAVKAELARATESSKAAAEKAADFDRLSQVWERDGLAGLVSVLTGGKQTLDQMVEERAAFSAWKAKASPAELAAHEAAERASAAERVAAAAKKEYEEYKKGIEGRQMAAEKAEVESYVLPAFQSHRFAGKLGDAAAEHRLDTMLFEGVRAELLALPEETPITARLVSQKFREAAAALNGAISKQVKQKVAGAVTQKKAEAGKQAQARVVATQRAASAEGDLRKMVAAGDITGAVSKFLRGGPR